MDLREKKEEKKWKEWNIECTRQDEETRPEKKRETTGRQTVEREGEESGDLGV